ncbi:uncharacterized protein LOC126996316 isoform X2 [Eriocheir sinensis]|nr:uncharacterized protein LOC126996316 isoform X2 [Eriocheir sinensis]
MNFALRLVVVVVAAALANTSVAAHPAWTSDGPSGAVSGRVAHLPDPEEGGMRVVPVLMVALSEPRAPRPTAAHKRNSELLNTLLGSQTLSNMRNAGRR